MISDSLPDSVLPWFSSAPWSHSTVLLSTVQNDGLPLEVKWVLSVEVVIWPARLFNPPSSLNIFLTLSRPPVTYVLKGNMTLSSCPTSLTLPPERKGASSLVQKDKWENTVVITGPSHSGSLC